MSDKDQDQQQDNRTPEEIEAEINDTRSHMDRTLDDFQQRFSSDSMMHNAMDYMKSDATREYFSNLGRTVRDNPMPAALIGLGIGWMMYSNNSSSSNPRVRNHFNDKRQKSARRDAANTPPQTHEYDDYLYDEDLYEEDLVDDDLVVVEETYVVDGDPSVGDDSVQGSSSESARQKAGRAKQGARDRMSRARRGAGEQMHNASDRARDTGAWLTNMAQENPIATGALGLAFGALIGGLVPASRTEQQAMGRTRDRVVDRATQAGSEQLNKASDKAQEKGEQHRRESGDSRDEHASTGGIDAMRTNPDTTSGPDHLRTDR